MSNLFNNKLNIQKYGIGVDIIEIERFDILQFKKEKKEGIFTKKEVEYCESQPTPARHYAVRFAGKEAVLKAFSSCGIQLTVRQIEILGGHKTVPKARVYNTKELKKHSIKLSLSHSETMAIAFAVIVLD